MRHQLFIAAVAALGMLGVANASFPINTPTLQQYYSEYDPGNGDPVIHNAYPNHVKEAIKNSWFFRQGTNGYDAGECHVTEAEAKSWAEQFPGTIFVVCTRNWRQDSLVVAFKPTQGAFAGQPAQFLTSHSNGYGHDDGRNIVWGDEVHLFGCTHVAYSYVPAEVSFTGAYNQVTDAAANTDSRWWNWGTAAAFVAYGAQDLGNNDYFFAYQTDGTTVHFAAYTGGSMIYGSTLVTDTHYNGALINWGKESDLAFPVAVQSVAFDHGNWEPLGDPATNLISFTVHMASSVQVDTPINIAISAEGHSLELSCAAGATSSECQTFATVGHLVVPAGASTASRGMASKGLPIKASGSMTATVGASPTTASGGSYYTGHAGVASASATFTNSAGSNCGADLVPETLTDGTQNGCMMYCPVSGAEILTDDWANGLGDIINVPWWNKQALAQIVSLSTPTPGANVPFAVLGSGAVRVYVAGTTNIIEVTTGSLYKASMGARDANLRCSCAGDYVCPDSETCAVDEHCGTPPAPIVATPNSLAISNTPQLNVLNPAGAGNELSIDIGVEASVQGQTTVFVHVDGWAYTTDYTCADGVSCSSHTVNGNSGVRLIIGLGQNSASFVLNINGNAAGKQVVFRMTAADNADGQLIGTIAEDKSSSPLTVTKPAVNALSWVTQSPVSLKQSSVGANTLEISVGIAQQYNFPVLVHITQNNFPFSSLPVTAGITQDGNTDDFFLTIESGETSRTFSIVYSGHAALTASLTATQGNGNANLDINGGAALTDDITFTIPSITDAKFNDNSQLTVALTETSTRDAVITLPIFAHDVKVTLSISGVNSADVSAAGLTIGCAIGTCASTVELTIPSGTTSFSYTFTFLASGNGRTMGIALSASQATVANEAMNGDQLTTVFQDTNVQGGAGETLPAGTYKKIDVTGTSGARASSTAAAGATVTFEADENGAPSTIAYATLTAAAGGKFVFKAGTQFGAGVELVGEMEFEGPAVNLVDVKFSNGKVTLPDNAVLSQTAYSGRRLLDQCAAANQMFTDSAVVLGAGAQVSTFNLGTVTSWESVSATLTAQASYCAGNAFITLVAGASDPNEGTVSITGGEYESKDTSAIIPLIDEYATQLLKDVNINGVTIKADGTAFDASHPGMIGIANAAQRLVVKSNIFDFGGFLNNPVGRAITGASNFALISIAGNDAATSHATFEVESNSLVEACRNYIMADPSLRQSSDAPRCSAQIAIRVTGNDDTAIAGTISKIEARAAAITPAIAWNTAPGCAELQTERALNLMNIDLKGNENDILMITDTCAAGCYNPCHLAEYQTVDATVSYSQYVDVLVEHVASTGEIKHTVFVKTPAGVSPRFYKMAVSEWDSATATDYSNGVCDSSHGATGLPATPPTATGNQGEFATAQTTPANTVGGEWTFETSAATHNFEIDGATQQVENLDRYVGMLSLEEIRGCADASAISETYLGGDGGNIEREVKYYVWVYGVESSEIVTEGNPNTVSYPGHASGGKTVMQWKYEIKVVVYSDGFVSTDVVAGNPVVAVVDAEILSILDGTHLNEYDVTIYLATQHFAGEVLRLASPFYSSATSQIVQPCTDDNTLNCNYGFSILPASFTPACMTSHPFSAQYPFNAYCVQKITIRSSEASDSNVLKHTFTLSFNYLTSSESVAVETAIVVVTVEDHRTLVNDDNLLNPTVLLADLALDVSKFTDYSVSTCEVGDLTGTEPCTFSEGEAAIAEVRYEENVFNAGQGQIRPGQLNIDIISADACISTATGVTSNTAFNTGTAKCSANGAVPGNCGCSRVVPKRSIHLANSQCLSTKTTPTCHNFQCVNNACEHGRRHGAGCSTDRDCNSDPSDSNNPYTCIGGRASGSKCNVAGDCPASVALTSCTASSTDPATRFINDLAVKQYDITYPFGKCTNDQGVDNGAICNYVAQGATNSCPTTHPQCVLEDIVTGTNGIATAGALTDFDTSVVKPAKALCEGKLANGDRSGAFVACRRANDGPWNPVTVPLASAVCAVEAECVTLDNNIAVGFLINPPFYYQSQAVFFDFRVRVSFSLPKTTQRPSGFEALYGAFEFDLTPQTSSATTSVNAVINVGNATLNVTQIMPVCADGYNLDYSDRQCKMACPSPRARKQMDDHTQDCFCDVNPQTHLYGDCPELYPMCHPETKTCTKSIVTESSDEREVRARTVGLSVGISAGVLTVAAVAAAIFAAVKAGMFAGGSGGIPAMEKSETLLKGLTVSNH